MNTVTDDSSEGFMNNRLEKHAVLTNVILISVINLSLMSQDSHLIDVFLPEYGFIVY